MTITASFIGSATTNRVAGLRPLLTCSIGLTLDCISCAFVLGPSARILRLLALLHAVHFSVSYIASQATLVNLFRVMVFVFLQRVRSLRCHERALLQSAVVVFLLYLTCPVPGIPCLCRQCLPGAYSSSNNACKCRHVPCGHTRGPLALALTSSNGSYERIARHSGNIDGPTSDFASADHRR
jgi:hypothetical protein